MTEVSVLGTSTLTSYRANGSETAESRPNLFICFNWGDYTFCFLKKRNMRFKRMLGTVNTAERTIS